MLWLCAERNIKLPVGSLFETQPLSCFGYRSKREQQANKQTCKYQIKRLMFNLFLFLVSNKNTKHFGFGSCCWHFIHHFHHLHFLGPLKRFISVCAGRTDSIFLFILSWWSSNLWSWNVFCWAAARAYYPSLLFLLEKWGTQHASLAVQPLACFLVKTSHVLKLKLAKVFFFPISVRATKQTLIWMKMPQTINLM